MPKHALLLQAKAKARTQALPQIQEWILSHFTAADKLIKVAQSQQDLYLHKHHPVDFQSITIIAASSICLFIGNREHRPEMLDLLFFFISAYFNFLLQVNGQVPLLAAKDCLLPRWKTNVPLL